MTVNLSNPKLESESIDKSSKLIIVDGKLLIADTSTPGQEVWKTGISSKGISADLMTAGSIDTKVVQIYNGDNPTFKWDSKGISAYDYTFSNEIISGVNTNKFVRFDKNGIYGINGVADDSWVPTSLDDINEKSTFALTWDGLKVTGNNGLVARMGKLDGSIFKIGTADQNIIEVKEDGTSLIGNMTIENLNNLISGDVSTNNFSWKFSPTTGITMWNGS
jgi:hypothetical protein